MATPFSEALCRVLDLGDPPCTRKLWAACAGVTPAALSQWASGKTLPKPMHLRLIVAAAEQGIGRDTEELAALHQVMNLPKRKSCPGFKFPEANLGAYSLRTLSEAASLQLAALPVTKHEQLLYALGGTVRAWGKEPDLTIREALQKGADCLEPYWPEL